jgi:hypothetical protein
LTIQEQRKNICRLFLACGSEAETVLVLTLTYGLLFHLSGVPISAETAKDFAKLMLRDAIENVEIVPSER